MLHPHSYLLLFLILCSTAAYGQLRVKPPVPHTGWSASFSMPAILLNRPDGMTSADQRPLGPIRATTFTPPAFCAADLAFFCRLEYRIEQAVRMPVRFRLGDVDTVDYLEGKRVKY